MLPAAPISGQKVSKKSHFAFQQRELIESETSSDEDFPRMNSIPGTKNLVYFDSDKQES